MAALQRPTPAATAAAVAGSDRGGGEISELLSPDYGSWRDGIDSFRERAARRVAATQKAEATYKDLERRRAEDRARRELEDRRKKEASERAEQRKQEAAEYSKWRGDVILAKRAEERARAVEYAVFRDDCTNLRRGLLTSGEAPRAATAIAVAAAAREECLARVPRIAEPRLASREAPAPSSARSFFQDAAWRDAVGGNKPERPSASGVWEADRRRLDEDAAWRDAVGRNRQERPSASRVGEADRRLLDEEAAWRDDVSRNRQALAEVRSARGKRAQEFLFRGQSAGASAAQVGR